MKEILHFNSQKERLAYLKGDFEEIIPKEVKADDKKSKSDDEKSKNEKKSQKSASKVKKQTKKDEDNGKVLAE